jgi:heme A synthase
MNETTRAATLRRLAGACVLLMLVVTCASAWLRLGQPRPRCIDWPGCRSAEMPPGPLRAASALGPPGLQALVRGTHRGAASLVLAASLALAGLALLRRPRQASTGRQSLVLLGLALALAGLGIVTPGSTSPAVLLGNLLGGLLMLAWSWRLLRGLQGAPPPAPAGAWPWLAAAAWLAQAALGALSGAGVWPGDGAAIAHLSLALCALPLAGWIGWRARRAGRRAEGLALLGVVAVQVLLGSLAVASAASAPAVLVHNLGAGVGLALLCGLTATRDAPHRAGA